MGVAQLDRASDYGSEGRGFEPSRPRLFSERGKLLTYLFLLVAIFSIESHYKANNVVGTTVEQKNI